VLKPALLDAEVERAFLDSLTDQKLVHLSQVLFEGNKTPPSPMR
jgi:hypothetical protein